MSLETLNPQPARNRQHSADPAPGITQLGIALHDLCQPLTTLQCRLELAELMHTDADYREAVAVGLVECARLAECVTRMREMLRTLLPEISDPEIHRVRH